MKKLITLSAAALAIVCLSGCTLAVPKTQITGSLGGKPFSFSGPKDATVTGLQLQADTNGAVTLKIESLNSKNNPDVVTASGSAYSAQVKAISEAFNSGVAAAAAAAASGAKTAATTP